MRKHLTLCALMLFSAVGIAQAQSGIDYLDSLFEEGRHSYADIGNKVQLLRVIETCDETIRQGFAEGWLTQRKADSLMLDVKLDKLRGDYHYLNSDTDSHSYAIAESHFQEALRSLEAPEKQTWQQAIDYQFVLHEELAQLYYKQQRYPEAYAQMLEARKYSSRRLDSIDKILDFISQIAICEARVGRFKDAINNINTVVKSYPDKTSESYGEALRKKAKILMLQEESGDTGLADPIGEALKCYEDYFALKKDDALRRLGDMDAEDREQYWMRIRPFVVDCYRSEGADPAFLYDVTLFGKSLLLEYAQKGQPQVFTWQQVQQQLKATDCAVEFVQYEKNGTKRMGALVLRKQGKPCFVSLGETAHLEDLPLEGGGNLLKAVSTDDDRLKNNLYRDSSNFSYIWTPDLLEAIGKDTKRLYFAPDGLFHVLAIEYMLPGDASLKSENLYRLTSTRQLLASDSNTHNTRGSDLLLCGGINYWKAATRDNDEGVPFNNDGQAYRNLQDKRLTSFGNLPNSKTEIEGIHAICSQWHITSLSDTLATETRAAHLISQHSIVLLSTHGFYLGYMPQGTDLIPSSYDESLSQSGILLAGGSAALNNYFFDTSQHDGIFSSREIAQMDYSGVKLIVLSACQTALGYMTDDGVYGLQRSLKNAGVKAMILSLWSVHDGATAQLMQNFFNHLTTEDIHTAFFHAREELINTHCDSSEEFNPETLTSQPYKIDYSAPQYSNAFILIDIK